MVGRAASMPWEPFCGFSTGALQDVAATGVAAAAAAAALALAASASRARMCTRTDSL